MPVTFIGSISIVTPLWILIYASFIGLEYKYRIWYHIVAVIMEKIFRLLHIIRYWIIMISNHYDLINGFILLIINFNPCLIIIYNIRKLIDQ